MHSYINHSTIACTVSSFHKTENLHFYYIFTFSYALALSLVHVHVSLSRAASRPCLVACAWALWGQSMTFILHTNTYICIPGPACHLRLFALAKALGNNCVWGWVCGLLLDTHRSRNWLDHVSHISISKTYLQIIC